MSEHADLSDERAKQIDAALRASQAQERQESADDLERQRRTDEAIVAALAREDHGGPTSS